jgi:uncharacterized Rossmann fold enzyme
MTTLVQPLKIDVSQFGVAGQHLPNIRAACLRGLPELAPALVSHDGTMVVVGSGPSLPAFAADLHAERAKGRPICAVKGSHDWLCDQGVEPDLFVSVEPRDRRHHLQRKNQHTCYLLASRVSPDVFDHLKDCRVMLWHSYGHQDEVEAVHEHAKYAIGGGSTSGLRAIAVCYLMGFRNFILYGFDSCNDAHGQKRFDGSQSGLTTDVIVGHGATRKQFTCNMAMAAQANEFQLCTYGLFPDIHVESKGPGLISAILDERKRAGKRV